MNLGNIKNSKLKFVWNTAPDSQRVSTSCATKLAHILVPHVSDQSEHIIQKYEEKYEGNELICRLIEKKVEEKQANLVQTVLLKRYKFTTFC